MSRPVSQEHWEMWLGNMPKPEEATLEMMWAAHDALQQYEDKEEDILMLAECEKSRVNYIQKKDYWLTRTDAPDYQEKLDIYNEILNLIDESIELLREKING